MSVLKEVLSWFLLVLTALLLSLPYLPPSLASTMLAIGYTALPIIIANALAAIFRRGPWRWAHLAVVVLCLPLFSNYVPMTPRQAKAGEKAHRVISWNADNFLVSPDTMRHSARYIRSLHPDIICLQERPHEVKVSWTDILAAFPQHHYAARNSREDEVLNLAVLSRHPIIATGERMFHDTYNKYMWADVVVGTDTLRIYSVHLQTTGIAPAAGKDKRSDDSNGITSVFREVTRNALMRNEQTLRLCSDINSSPYPVIVCGDFNDTPSGYPARRLRRLLTDISRRWPLHGSFDGLGGIMKIDYIMCSSQLRPLSYQLVHTPWSDHSAQVGEVALTTDRQHTN